jgi:uncharacterized RDD family membrane protein YckC
MAQLIDGIILGVVCGTMFFVLSGGEVHSIWVSPMIPQYLLEVSQDHINKPLDFLWGGNYFSISLFYEKTFHLAYPAPLVWIIYGLYYTLFAAIMGQTPGKMVKNLVILDLDQKQIPFSRSLFRWLGYIISLLPFGLGFWWAARNENNQGWHDLLTSATVLYFEKN